MMGIASFFTGMWSKVSLVFSIVIAILALRGKYQSARIDHQSDKLDDLEHANKMILKKVEISKNQESFKEDVLVAEQESIRKEGHKHEAVTIDDINNL
jgi:hypothetical protein